MIKLALKKSNSHWIEIDNVKFLVDYPTNEQEMKLQEVMLDNQSEDIKRLRYARLYLKCTIKDWQGIDAKCLVINNELDNELWQSLVSDTMQTLTVFGKIYDELNFTESDKKKS